MGDQASINNDSPNDHSIGSDLTPRTAAKYFSLVLPKSVLTNNNSNLNTSIEELVFTDVKKASSLLKKVKGSRLKMFNNFEDALNCSIEGLDDEEVNLGTSEGNGEGGKASSGFSAPSTPDLSRLRRAIEKGELSFVQITIFSNPRYLISSADSPVILMEGPRYNAVHVASKSNQVDILKFVLATINDPQFYQKMYPNDDIEISEATRKHLLDLYLNTPDKAGLDTPLHLASKFGAADCVKVLLSYPDCDRERRNKLGEKAIDVICSRKGDEKAKTQIKQYFEARYYVAINRNVDRVTVCKPSESPPRHPSISGIAGPMSPDLAEKLYDALKSPGKSISPKNFRIRFTDASRGVERIARMECHQNKLNWVEYWPFLNCYVDLASPEGLQKLEAHLKKVHDDLTADKPEEELSQLMNFSERSTISLLCDRLGSLALTSNQDSQSINNDNQTDLKDKNDEDDEVNSGDGEDNFLTPPSSPLVRVDYFIDGKLFTQNDKDAANALVDIIIDELEYPYVSHWYRKVTLRQSVPSPFARDIKDDSLVRDVFETTPYSSTPRKSINLIDLITPRRFPSSRDELPEEDEEEDDDEFQDSICFLDETDEKENLYHGTHILSGELSHK